MTAAQGGSGTAWLVGLDVDGTILLQDETMSPGVPEAVARLRDGGHEVTIATGRSWMAHAALRRGARADRRLRGVLERRGDHATHRATGGSGGTSRRSIRRPVLSLLRERLPDARYMVELGSGQRLYTAQLDDWTLDGGRQVRFEELAAAPVSRIVVVSPGHDEDDFHRLVADAGLNEVSYAIGWTAWLDIAPQGVDKGTAMERVRARLGIDGRQVLVAGDGRNDIGMFGWALGVGGRAVAMGQAPDVVKDAAGEVTGDVVDGGLAVALDTLPAPIDVGAGEVASA